MVERDDDGMPVDWLTPHYPWEGDPIPGIFHQTQARALARTGTRVRVIAPIPFAPPPLPRLSEHWRRYADAPKEGRDGAIVIHRPRYLALPGQPGWALPGRNIAWAAGRIARTDPSADLIHAHFAVPSGLAARRLAPSLGRPYVVTVHGHDATSWPAAHAGRLDEYRATLTEAAAVITVSRALAVKVRDLSGVRATTIPLGIDHTGFRAAALPRLDARRLLDLPDDRTIVLFTARLVPHKGLREFVDAVLQLAPPIMAVILGEGPLAGYRAEEGSADRLIEYRGGQPSATVARYMSAADLFVLPSYQEGLPTVLVEAGSLGLPIVASAVDGTPELLADDRGLLLPEIAPATIRDAILQVVADPRSALARADRLRAHVEEAYDVDQNVVRLLALYREVVAEHPISGQDGSRARP
jgi:teichuronic acid biosynthesis glycosyltransferase TuaC